ncbi:MAG: tRNA (guanosine(46)-N7)-methyltransferase TrmB [Candidatus Fimisoma sp.]
MRQRNIKNLQEKLEQNSGFLVREPETVKGRWAELFGNDNPIYLELGCGKGKFISRMAQDNPDRNYIAIEGQSNVALRALEKAQEGRLANLRIFIDYVHDLQDYFTEGELDGIYLNFSDPWPKARHAKRRLTHRNRLENYRKVLSDEGTVEFKTDNDGLFDFTMEELEEGGFEILQQTRDLHKSGFSAAEITTEYEERFKDAGKNINFVKFR